jgi:prepilin-type N-terminal cleavage/methylation domain-containing protein
MISKRDEGFTLIEVMIVVAIIAQEAYYVDNRCYTNNISNLTASPYNLYISQGVNMAVSSATNEAYLMTAFHSAGNITYALSGPGGTISP